MIINHNMNALNAHRNMGVNNTAAGNQWRNYLQV